MDKNGDQDMAGNQGNNSLTDWDLFVLRHQSLPNVAVHFVSFLLFWLSPVLGLFFSPWWWFGFFASGLVGTAGHYFFKDGTVDKKEATSSLQVVQFSSAMAFLFIIGRYPKAIVDSKMKFRLYKQGRLPSSADPKLFEKLGALT
jgi:hypothetical protein